MASSLTSKLPASIRSPNITVVVRVSTDMGTAIAVFRVAVSISKVIRCCEGDEVGRERGGRGGRGKGRQER